MVKVMLGVVFGSVAVFGGVVGAAGGVRAHPRVHASLTCDYLLSADFESSVAGHFVAGGDLRNTGNIGVVVRVKGSWRRLGSNPVELVKRYRLVVGQSRTVNLRVAASGEDIDAHQASGSKCSVTQKITATFGQAR